MIREPDPAQPEKYPHIFWLGKCGACNRCYINRFSWRCAAGGPFNANYECDPKAFIQNRETK